MQLFSFYFSLSLSVFFSLAVFPSLPHSPVTLQLSHPQQWHTVALWRPGCHPTPSPSTSCSHASYLFLSSLLHQTHLIPAYPNCVSVSVSDRIFGPCLIHLFPLYVAVCFCLPPCCFVSFSVSFFLPPVQAAASPLHESVSPLSLAVNGMSKFRGHLNHTYFLL